MMESKNKPMDAYEWAVKTYGDQIQADIEKKMERYAQYRLSFVPPDIEKAIEEKAKIRFAAVSKFEEFNHTRRQHQDTFIEAARFGYSLHAEDTLRFAEWVSINGYKYCDYPDAIWVSDTDFNTRTTQELYEIFTHQ